MAPCLVFFLAAAKMNESLTLHQIRHTKKTIKESTACLAPSESFYAERFTGAACRSVFSRKTPPAAPFRLCAAPFARSTAHPASAQPRLLARWRMPSPGGLIVLLASLLLYVWVKNRPDRTLSLYMR